MGSLESEGSTEDAEGSIEDDEEDDEDDEEDDEEGDDSSPREETEDAGLEDGLTSSAPLSEEAITEICVARTMGKIRKLVNKTLKVLRKRKNSKLVRQVARIAPQALVVVASDVLNIDLLDSVVDLGFTEVGELGENVIPLEEDSLGEISLGEKEGESEDQNSSEEDSLGEKSPKKGGRQKKKKNGRERKSNPKKGSSRKTNVAA